MADKFVEVEIRGVKELVVKLNRSLSKPAQIDIVNEVGALLLNRIRTRFLAETDPDGQKWVESKAARRRKASGGGGGTLFDTGALFNSIQFSRFAGDSAKIVTDVPYAIEHQEGIGQVQRVFMGFSTEDVTFSAAFISKRIEEKFASG